MERRRAGLQISVAISALAISACASSDIDVAPTDEAPATVVQEDEELFTEREAITAVDDEGQPVEPVTESLPPVAETGLPGIDSDDAFCRAWSAYAGSVQALSLAWVLQPPEAAAALEVASSAAVIAAVRSMANDLPDEIESNRQELTADVPGPFLRRSERARQLLVDAGLSSAQIDELGAAWIDAITEQGIDTETLRIDVPEAAAGGLEQASQIFVAELPPIVEDPTLDTTAFDIGPSLAYISANCPDQGTLAGNDVIDSGGS